MDVGIDLLLIDKKLHVNNYQDASVYEAMVKLSQDFSTRYPLVDGHGNFGSVDGDSAAAMRYTEARMTKFGEELLNNIRKNTVEFKENYDGEEQEPKVLPVLIPNLLANGTTGIAVGMASKIPPHNLNDLYDACNYMIDKLIAQEEVNIEDIIKIIKAPDFPTGGTIIGTSGIKEAYRTGKGSFILRSKYEITEEKGYPIINITEIPYKVNKAKMIEAIEAATKEKRIKDKKGKEQIVPAIFAEIKEVQDLSNKQGLLIKITLKKDTNPQLLINKLIANSGSTKFEISYNIQLLALKEDMEPKLFNVQELLEQFLAHATSVLIKKYNFDLNKFETRLNIINGLIHLFDINEETGEEILNDVISIYRKSDDPQKDMLLLGFNEAQTEYIMNMKLNRLCKAEESKTKTEKEEILKNIDEINEILQNESILLTKIKLEFEDIRKRFGDNRRTNIETNYLELEEEDLIKEETMVITYTTDGIIKAVPEEEYKSQNKGGKGTKGATIKKDEIIKFMITSSNKDDLLFFTSLGRCHLLKAYKLGKSSRVNKGRSINNYLKLEIGEKIISMINCNLSSISQEKNNYLLFVTKLGQIKKLALNQLSSRMNSTKVINFREGDSLIQSLLIEENDNIIIVTKKGMSLRVDTSAQGTKAIRPCGRTAMGVCGITLKKNDEVVDMCKIKDTDSVLTVTEKGLGKRTPGKEWRVIGRGGKGVCAHSLTEKTGDIVSVLIANDEDELFVATILGTIIRIKSNSIRLCSRTSMGSRIINLKEDDKVASISINREEEELEE